MTVLVGTLIAGQGRVEASLVDAILGALAAVARDDEGRIAIQEAGGIPLIIKLMDGGPDMVPRHWRDEAVQCQGYVWRRPDIGIRRAVLHFKHRQDARCCQTMTSAS